MENLKNIFKDSAAIKALVLQIEADPRVEKVNLFIQPSANIVLKNGIIKGINSETILEGLQKAALKLDDNSTRVDC